MYGLGMLAAGIILAIMIVPIIASITREVLTAVPQNQREAVLALGATRWEMIRMGVLRNARIGIVGGVILGLGRALGETMAVTMVIGNRPEIAKSLFAPGYTMASVIANEFSEATGDLYLSALVEIGLGAVHCHADRERAGPAAGVEHHRRNCEGPVPDSVLASVREKLSLWRRSTDLGATAFAIARGDPGPGSAARHLRLPGDQRYRVREHCLPDPDPEAAGRARRRHGKRYCRHRRDPG